MTSSRPRKLDITVCSEEELEQKAYDRAIRSLSMSACSCEKMRSKLLERGFPETVVELVLTRLKEQKFLDDEEYAQGIVKHEVLVSCRSKKLAELKLRSLNVDEEIIRGALERVGDDEVLQRQTEFVDRAIERLELHRAEDADDELGLPKSFRRLLGQAARKDIPYELVTARWEMLVKGNY